MTGLVASICRDGVIEARPDEVGAALRDWGALHTDHTPAPPAAMRSRGRRRRGLSYR